MFGPGVSTIPRETPAKARKVTASGILGNSVARPILPEDGVEDRLWLRRRRGGRAFIRREELARGLLLGLYRNATRRFHVDLPVWIDLLSRPRRVGIFLAFRPFRLRRHSRHVLLLSRLGDDVVAAFAINEPYIVDRMLDGVEARLAANIQPVKMRRYLLSRVTSSTSRKAVVFGLSVGGRL